MSDEHPHGGEDWLHSGGEPVNGGAYLVLACKRDCHEIPTWPLPVSRAGAEPASWS